MPDDQSFEWLHQQLNRVVRRIERLEGKYEEISRQVVPPEMLFPKRREIEALERRVAALERRDGADMS